MDLDQPVDFLDLSDNLHQWVPEPWMQTKTFTLVTLANLAACIDSCLNSATKKFSLDLETTGLDTRVYHGSTISKIVGVCLSGDGETGWYIPLRHQGEGAAYNIPWGDFDREFRRLMAAVDEGKVVAIFHNGKFDQEFLEFNGSGLSFGNWDSQKTWEDTLILAYLRNSRARSKKLKRLSLASPEAVQESECGGPGLGMKMLELEEVFILVFGETKAKSMTLDFSLLDPSNPIVLSYACSDAVCTYLLYFLLAPVVIGKKADPDQKQIYAIEKSAVAGTRWMERNCIPVSKAKVQELIALGQQEWFDSVMEVYQAAAEILGRDVMPGWYKVLRDSFVATDENNLLSHQMDRARSLENRYYPNPIGKIRGKGADGKEQDFPLIYDVGAPQQLGVMFDEMQVPGLKRTENSGQVKTSKDELKRVVEEAGDSFPFMGKIQRFREVNKALATYLYPMLLGMDPTNQTIRISFNGHKVDTGRFATPSKDKEEISATLDVMVGWPELNFQAMPATYDPRRPACMNRIRECITARPDFYIVAVDFSGEELRLITNIYKEPKWENEFFRCSGCAFTFPKGDGSKTPPAPPLRCPNCGSDKIGDLHTLTALEINGPDAIHRPEWKELRKDAKGVNFGLSYGGGGAAVCRATGCDKNEGWRIKQQFDATYNGLSAGWKRQHEYAKRHKYVLTGFGRKYPLPDIDHPDGGFRSKAERNSVNGPIQGSGADIIKIAMALVYKKCKEKGWLDKVRMIATMHDELVFEIHCSVLEEAIEILVPVMTSNPMILAMRWPVPFTSDVELGFDYTVKWALAEMQYREVRFDGNKKIKKPGPPQADDKDFKGHPEKYQAALAAYPEKVATWEALPHSWPECLRPYFKCIQGGASPPPTPPPAPEHTGGESETGSEGGARTTPPPATEPVVAGPSSTTEVPVQQRAGVPAPKLKQHEDFLLMVNSLSPMVLLKLSQLIEKFGGHGTHRLRLQDGTGKMLEGWDRAGAILVDGPDFYYAARHEGLT